MIFNVFQTWMAWRDVAPLSHTELMQMLEQGKAASATITETTMQGRFKEPQDGRSLFVSVRVDPNAGSTATVSMPTFLGLCRAAGDGGPDFIGKAKVYVERQTEARLENEVPPDDFTEAVERMVVGAERHGRLLCPQESERVTYHGNGPYLGRGVPVKDRLGPQDFHHFTYNLRSRVSP
ncbi:hypothetical protein [Shinella sp. M31]|uniref:hypothetical protein n=1 Tax=Shinella sp. M31 TaxID=3368615 RepID=UPI003BA22239